MDRVRVGKTKQSSDVVRVDQIVDVLGITTESACLVARSAHHFD
jgi:hypothetical protein